MTRCAVAALAVLVTGCGGGGDDRLSEQDFRRQANAICTEYDGRVEELGEPSSADEVVEFAAQAAELTRSGVAEMRALRPPEKLEPAFDRFLAEGDTVVELSEQLARAARAQDTAQLEQIVAEAQASDRRSDRAARELGLTACQTD